MKVRHQPAGVVLLTGFEPFGDNPVNPSADIALALNGQMISGHRVVGHVLPCEFGTARRQMSLLLRRLRPRLVVGLGLAANRTEINPERVALNVDDARIPDNAGQQPVDRPVVRGGPAAYWSTLPVKAIVAALRTQGLPASVSHSAGTFVCNHVFYGLMHALRRHPRIRGGFIHVPPAKRPRRSLAQLTQGIALAVEVALQTPRDLHTPAGSTE